MKASRTPAVERRSVGDRREKRFGNLKWLLKRGRRRRVRRASDQFKIHALDAYPQQLFILVILILGLSVADGLLTLWLTDSGASEINPVMAYYLRQGPQIFMAAKYLITAAVVLLAVAMNHSVFRIIKVGAGFLLAAFAGCFAMVVAWELFLFLMAHRMA